MLLYASLTVAILIMLLAVSIFLYKNFYQTIAQSEEIIILKGKLAIENIDINKFESVIEKIKQKKSPRQLKNINNPF